MPRKEKTSTLENVPLFETQVLEHPEDESLTTDSPGIIILHPGSSTLRLSLSNQLDPFYIPHLIAYCSENSSAQDLVPNCVKVLKPSVNISEELSSQRDVGFESIAESVVEARATNGVFDAESDTSQYSVLNSKSCVKPCVPDDEVSFQFSDLGTNPMFVIGHEVFNLPSNALYKVYKPLRYGRLNVEGGLSRMTVLKQLEDLWCRAIEECLDIPRKDFKESVCATYGAGLSTACVVDVGEEKTHVCCVEDGISNINARVTLDYGGNDITRFFYWLLKRANFPYKECSEESMMDGHLVQKLKERYCHFDMTIWGVAEEEIIIPYQGNGGTKFRIHFADELVYAPVSVYYPSCFCLPDDRMLMNGQNIQPVMLEDVYDESHWTTEQSQDKKGGGCSNPKNVGSDHRSSNGTAADVLPEALKRLKSIEEGRILALDQAVHFSIDCASSAEMKKKLYGSVLLIGGGLSFSHASLLLQSRLESSLPAQFSKGSDTVEVSSNPRDLNPQMVSWRGGAVLAMLDSCQELWVEHQDWELFGVRLLREKAPFVW